jgi:Outer membrane protein beta-barrel domain
MLTRPLLLVCLACLALAPASFGQSVAPSPTPAKWRLGLRAGLNLMQLRDESVGVDLENSSVPGGQVGALVCVRLGGRWWAQPGASLVWRGGRTTLAGIELRGGISYLDLPVAVGYRLARLWPAQNGGLWLAAAPYLSVALGGTLWVNGVASTLTFGELGTFKRLDAGGKLGLHLQRGRWELQAGYDLGLVNVSNVPGTVTRSRGVFGSLVFYVWQR